MCFVGVEEVDTDIADVGDLLGSRRIGAGVDAVYTDREVFEDTQDGEE